MHNWIDTWFSFLYGIPFFLLLFSKATSLTDYLAVDSCSSFRVTMFHLPAFFIAVLPY